MVFWSQKTFWLWKPSEFLDLENKWVLELGKTGSFGNKWFFELGNQAVFWTEENMWFFDLGIRQFFELKKTCGFWNWRKQAAFRTEENRWFLELKNWRNHCYFISREQNPLFSCLKVGKSPPFSPSWANSQLFSNLEFLGNLDSGVFLTHILGLFLWLEILVFFSCLNILGFFSKVFFWLWNPSVFFLLEYLGFFSKVFFWLQGFFPKVFFWLQGFFCCHAFFALKTTAPGIPI